MDTVDTSYVLKLYLSLNWRVIGEALADISSQS